MRFVCDRCGKKYHTAEEPAPGHVYRMRCKVCGNPIVVTAGAAGAAPSSGQTPSPGAPAPRAAPATPPPAPPPLPHRTSPVARVPRAARPAVASGGQPPRAPAARGDEAAPVPGRSGERIPAAATPVPDPWPPPQPAAPLPSEDVEFDAFSDFSHLAPRGPDDPAASREPAPEPPFELISPDGETLREAPPDDPFAAAHRLGFDPLAAGGAGPAPHRPPAAPAPGPAGPGHLAGAQHPTPAPAARRRRSRVPLLASAIILLAVAGAGAASFVIPRLLARQVVVRAGQLSPIASTAPASGAAGAPSAAADASAATPAPPAAPAPAAAPPPADAPPAGKELPAVDRPAVAAPAAASSAAAAPAGAAPAAPAAGSEPSRGRRQRRRTEVSAAGGPPATAPAPEQPRSDDKGAAGPEPLENKADAPAPAAPAPPPEELVDLTPQQVSSAIASHRKDFDGCLDEAVAKEPDSPFAGRRVGLYLTVNPSGAVSSPFVDDPDIDDASLGECLRSVGRKVVFPPFQGEPFQVRVPLALRQAPVP